MFNFRHPMYTTPCSKTSQTLGQEDTRERRESDLDELLWFTILVAPCWLFLHQYRLSDHSRDKALLTPVGHSQLVVFTRSCTHTHTHTHTNNEQTAIYNFPCKQVWHKLGTYALCRTCNVNRNFVLSLKCSLWGEHF